METKILVLGVGGAGCNIADKVYAGIRSYPYVNNIRVVAINTDRQSLINLKFIKDYIVLDKKGRGAGSDPERGRRLAIESWNEGKLERLKFDDSVDYDLIIVIAGLGGGTGTGAGPVVVEYLKENFSEAIVLSVLVLPDTDESGEKTELANKGLLEFYKVSDAIMLIDNSEIADMSKPLSEAYEPANEFTKNIVITVLDICERYGSPNIDFADIQNVLVKARDFSKFVFITSLEFPTQDSITDSEINSRISDVKRKTAVASFRGAPSLIVGAFHDGNLPSQKVKDFIEILKREIIQGGRSPFIKRGDYIVEDKTIRFGVIVGGVEVNSRITRIISSTYPERILEELHEGNP